MTQTPSLFEDDDIEIEHFDDDVEDVIPFKYSITSYGADYPVDGLVRRMQRHDVLVPPFQRGYVWTNPQGSRFVESLLLGLPVPGIFLSKEQGTERLLVIDGQQRLRTLQYFYNDDLRLTRVSPPFENLIYSHLEDEDRRRLDDAIIHATVIKQDEPSEDNSSIYHIFERLNTGGTQLNAQEIRACIYHGPLNALLAELNKHPAWREIYGKISSRMRDQELILRFLALYFEPGRYSKPMKGFLNAYMGANRQLVRQGEAEIREAFVPTVELVARCLGARAFRPKRALNAAVFDAVMVALANRLAVDPGLHRDEVRQSYQQLLEDEPFAESTSRRTSDESTVEVRLDIAKRAFAGS